jgi:hypothetical protein
LFDALGAYGSRAFAIAGVVSFILGLTSIRPLSFSEEAAVLLGLGGFFLMGSVLLHLRISRSSTGYEKIFALAASMSIVLLVMGVVAFTVVKVDFRLQNGRIEDYVVGSMPGHGSSICEDTNERMVVPVVTHIYSAYAAYLLLFSLVLLVLSVYIKTRYP